MEPRSFSATALNVADLCMARYKAEHIDYARGIQNSAASLGSAVHGALELFVKLVFFEKKETASIKLLLDLFKMQYMSIFATADTDTQDFTDGTDMLERWFERTIEYLSTVEILSAEHKEHFDIPTPIGVKPYNYIFDRLDKTGDGEYTIVDYKTNRLPVKAEDLKKRVQVRAYGLAVQIKYKDAQRIFVELDMLRHSGPVGVMITREDNVAAWKYFKERTKMIVDTDPKAVKETLNPECRFCTIKQSCEALRKNIAVGGVMALGSAEKMVNIRAELEFQQAGLAAVVKEIDEMIIAEAKQTDNLEWQSASYKMEITSSSRRSADSERVEKVLGPELFAKYGKRSITLATLDKLMKGTELSATQKAQLKGLFYMKGGEPKIKIQTLNPFD